MRKRVAAKISHVLSVDVALLRRTRVTIVLMAREFACS